MKVTLDVDKLLAKGRITPAEYARLKELAAEETNSLGFNLLIGFGVMATAAGALALFHSALASVLLGLILLGVGVKLLVTQHLKKWSVLGTILLLVGSITAAGGILVLTHGSVAGFICVTLLCLVGALLARSGLLAAMVALALAGAVDASTSYGHGSYFLFFEQPAVTVILFGLLSWGGYVLSLRVDNRYERLTLVFARTSLFLVNFGFWVGSLWGDSLWRKRESWTFHSGQVVPDWVFAAVWAVGLIATGIWAVRRNRRWVVNLSAVFGAIHLYTQYFERLGASPKTLLMGGLMAIAIAIAIAWYNREGRGRTFAQGPSVA